MVIEQTTTQAQIEDYINKQLALRKQKAIKALCYVGTQCENIARKQGGYKDRTGNLRSSVGYIVADNGTIIQASNFKTVKQGKDGSERGNSYVRELLEHNTSGLVLIVVAGMNYAKHVAARGYDVLDSAELNADALIGKLMKKLFQ
jgi:hypothetical protein